MKIIKEEIFFQYTSGNNLINAIKNFANKHNVSLKEVHFDYDLEWVYGYEEKQPFCYIYVEKGDNE